MSSVRCIQKNNHLSFIHRYNFQSRGTITEKLIRESILEYNLEKLNFDITVWTGDYLGDKWHSKDKDQPKDYMYSFCTYSNDFSKCFPSWIYDSWEETGVINTEEYIKQLYNSQPKTNKIGWIGNTEMSENRKLFLKHFRRTYFTQAYSQNESSRHHPNLKINMPSFLGFMTLQQQIDKWKYLIDLNARGYSGRLILFLKSPRIIFIVDTEYKEWYWKFLEPWKHYIPVKKDFSDLENNYLKIESDIKLQEYIKNNQRIFAKKFLTKQAALCKIADILTKNSNNNIFELLFNNDTNI